MKRVLILFILMSITIGLGVLNAKPVARPAADPAYEAARPWKEHNLLRESVSLERLAAQEQFLGQTHPDLVPTLNDLAMVYYFRGDYERTAEVLERVLKMHETEGLEYAQVLHNLGTAYFYLGQYAKAEPLYLTSLVIREAELGAEHPDVAQSLRNLSDIYLFDGQYEKAEPLLERVLAIREKVLGPEHAETARALHSLAELYRKTDRLEKSLEFHEKALSIRREHYSDTKQEIAGSLHNMGEVYRELGQVDRAAGLYREAVALYEASLGKEHVFTKVGKARLYEVTDGLEGAECACVSDESDSENETDRVS